MDLPRYRAAFAAACFALALAGCALAPREPAVVAPVGAPPDFPEAYYREAAAQGKPVLRIDPAGSLVVIEVRRAGKLAHLGHDHVVASHAVGGYVAPGEGRADLYVPLASLAVDEPALRTEAGLETQPTQADIAGTRANMLEHVLEADKFPFALIRVSGLDASKGSVSMNVSLTLHGATRTLEVPAQIEAGAELLLVTGRLSFNQSDFGIAPYSVLGGAIAVRDRLDLRFRISGMKGLEP